jgi:competence protein ComEC
MITILLVRAHRYAIIAVGMMVTLLAGDVWYWSQERWGRKELRVTHLDVGQGDAAVIELPGSRVLLIDAGGTATGTFDTGDAIVAPFLRSRKIVNLDYAMVSHARVDHYGGMRSMIKEFAPAEFWSGAAKRQNAGFENLEETIAGSQVQRRTLDNTEPCRLIDAVKLCVIHPPSNSGDDASVVLRLEFGKVRLLFAGDVDKREEQLLQENPEELGSAVIKVPRHGSATSSSEPFVSAVRPRLAIFSVGARNRFGLPKEEIVARYRQVGAEILRTDEDGAITL